MRHPAAVALLVCVCVHHAASAEAQAQSRDVPRRPALMAGADTNDAGAHYTHGASLVRRKPKEAAEAFYWAQRLDPTLAEAYYARRVALLLANPRVLVRYMDGDRGALRSREVQAADSLYRRALMVSPFMYRDLDREMIDQYVNEWARQVSVENSYLDRGALIYFMNQILMESGPEFRGWVAYTERRFPQALELYASALKQVRNKAGLHAERAHIMVLLARYAEAEAEITAALEAMRRSDRDNRVYVYQSKAFYEMSLGAVLEALSRRDDAMAAYGRALQEDLSYYPAHRRMAIISLASGDTAAALASLALGAALEDADVGLRFDYARLLVATGSTGDGAVELRRIIEAEPYFAAPYATLGLALEGEGKVEEAIAQYESFLERARRDDPHRRVVTARLTALRSQGGEAP